MRTLRKERGFSQENLAFESGLHPTYISAVERGEYNVSLDNITRIAETLGVPVAELFFHKK